MAWWLRSVRVISHDTLTAVRIYSPHQVRSVSRAIMAPTPQTMPGWIRSGQVRSPRQPYIPTHNSNGVRIGSFAHGGVSAPPIGGAGRSTIHDAQEFDHTCARPTIHPPRAPNTCAAANHTFARGRPTIHPPRARTVWMACCVGTLVGGQVGAQWCKCLRPGCPSQLRSGVPSPAGRLCCVLKEAPKAKWLGQGSGPGEREQASKGGREAGEQCSCSNVLAVRRTEGGVSAWTRVKTAPHTHREADRGRGRAREGEREGESEQQGRHDSHVHQSDSQASVQVQVIGEFEAERAALSGRGGARLDGNAGVSAVPAWPCSRGG